MQLPLVVLRMVGSFMSRSKWVSPTERRSCSESVAHAGTAEGLAQQLLAVDQEADTIAAALAAAQQPEHQFDEDNGVSCCCKS